MLPLVCGINSRLLSVNHALISPILTCSVIPVALLPLVPSTYHSHHPSPLHSFIPGLKRSFFARTDSVESGLTLWSSSMDSWTSQGVHLVPPGLLQLTAVRHQRRTTSSPAVGAERCRPPGYRRRRYSQITPVLWQLHWLPVRQRVVFKIAGLVHQSLVGAAPAYLADDCRLLSDVGRRPLQSNSNDMRKLFVS